MYYVVCNAYKSNTDDIYAKELVCWTDDEDKLQKYLQTESVKIACDIEIYMYECDWYEFLYILGSEYNVTCVDETYYELQLLHTKGGRSCYSTKYWYNLLIEEGDVVFDLLSELVETIVRLQAYAPYIDNKEFRNLLNYLLLNHISPMIKLYRESGDIHNSTLDLLGMLIQKGYM